jgi:hypothetical protein
MMPNTKERQLSSGGVAESREFGISAKDSAHIMTILRDTLYTDKIKAVLREYSSNAWDSHRASGKADVPIKVVLPTANDPTLSIRDYGSGLSQDDVFEVFTQYGASTKRNDDISVGMLGIGSKSGFAYSDSFTIVSYHEGSKKTYVAVLDESDKGIINLLNKEECGKETGVMIQIAVRPNDIWEFTEKAKNLFQYFEPRPIINVVLPPTPAEYTTLKHGSLTASGEEGWVAVMGCVPYRIDMDQIKNQKNSNSKLGEYVERVSGVLRFNIGEVQISASREELKYSDRTKEAIVNKLHALIEEFVQHTLAAIDDAKVSTWDRRLRSQVLKRLRLPVPPEYKKMVEDYVVINEQETKTFTISQYKTSARSIHVHDKTRLLLQDTDKSLAGYSLAPYDYLVLRNEGVEWDAVEKELTAFLYELEIYGVPIGKMSTLPWAKPVDNRRNPSKKYFNIKHRLKLFRLDMSSGKGLSGPWSKYWAPEDRTPTKDDVFVILSEFRTVGYDIFDVYRQDNTLATDLGATMPQVYGYKSTGKHPVKAADCLGTHYPEWRLKFAKSLLTDDVKDRFNRWQWLKTITKDHNFLHVKHDRPNNKIYEKIQDKLGDKHLVTVAVERMVEAVELSKKPNVLRGLLALSERLPLADDPIKKCAEAKKTLNDIFDAYPLLQLEGGIHNLWGDYADKWLQYIELIDEA